MPTWKIWQGINLKPPIHIESVGQSPPAANRVKDGSCCAEEPKDPGDHESTNTDNDLNFGGRIWHECREGPLLPFSGANARMFLQEWTLKWTSFLSIVVDSDRKILRPPNVVGTVLLCIGGH